MSAFLETREERRREARRGFRHLCLTFGVFTAASAVQVWWCRAAPHAAEEIGAGRAVVFLGTIVLWVLGLVLTIGFGAWLWTRAAPESTLLSRTLFWCLSIVYSVFVAMGPLSSLQ